MFKTAPGFIPLPLKGVVFVDDWVHDSRWDICEQDGTVLAQATSEQKAKEILYAVNFFRGGLKALLEEQTTNETS